ncbi:MAG: hypothetical protein KBT87_02130 [Gammaproteobacteria bacterium]|nr:hypothetical protein [Gammaproteobacteria bacterium]MBQ0773450.1 hypothetical protein [Gammaproteobacteria bacterium]
MKHLIPLLIATAFASIIASFGGESTALALLLGIVGSVIGWQVGKRIWAWINE